VSFLVLCCVFVSDIAADAPSHRKNSQSWAANKLRHKVSQEKKRFVKDGFDLDLSYISDRIIAMGFPAESVSSLIRNRMTETQAFMKHYHADHYWVYNLCAENKYDSEKFDNRAVHFPFYDHNPPPFQVLIDFCEHASNVLTSDSKNIVAVHCKAGKGRTGTVICCLLMFLKICNSADHALEYFAQRRTHNMKGVTIPSQRRYVHYFERYLINYRWLDRPLPEHAAVRRLTKVVIHTVPNFDVGGGCDPYFTMKRPDQKLFYDYRKHVSNLAGFKKGGDGITLECDALLQGDTRITFFDYDRLSKDDKMFAIWVNTNFIGNHLVLEKFECDYAHKDKNHKSFEADFAVELFFATTAMVDCTADDGESFSCSELEDEDEYD
jgi:phosphatidylinositol-3,4,5-trisphosphate 3-phosphatase and dual-specificity protein phosphatase PTEN